MTTELLNELEGINLSIQQKTQLIKTIRKIINQETDNSHKVTYAELKTLRDNSELVDGHLYRITDYVTITKQTNTKSARHPFDVIVLATSENELSHHAKAIAHEGDTYFDGNDLGAWELWYDLDNDTTKYEWADATNGKGVIYRMIDEKRNDCPYDFKNALFFNDKPTHNTTEDKYYYTFSYVVRGVLYDGTVEKQGSMCYGNSMGIYMLNKKRVLNKNVWRNINFQSICHGNALGNNCHDNIFGNSSHDNIFGSNCYNNTFEGSGYNNIFEGSCYNNTLGNNCHGNIFGNSSHDNTFENNCIYRKVNRNKTFITLNDEYYDDGSGQLVPIKHPDLSTQPSILPYKFMGNYVYEQLIPVAITTDNINEGYITIPRIEADIILSANLYFKVIFVDDVPSTSRYSTIACTVDRNELLSGTYDFIRFSSNGIYLSGGEIPSAYLRIVYTTMPEDSSYGYENY